jgi:hypothetical protein
MLKSGEARAHRKVRNLSAAVVSRSKKPITKPPITKKTPKSI